MCLALYKPQGVEVNWSALKEGMSSNRDGAGFAVVSNGQLIVEKGFFVYEDFRKALEPFADCAAIVHFRLATHGEKNKGNCHPFDLRDFPIPEDKEDKDRIATAIIHNGIFYDAASDQKQWSDTWHVCRDILHPIWVDHDKAFGRPEIVALGDKFVGSGNKLVFLSADGSYAIWGEKNGHWHEGIWYSNYSYEDFRWADPRSQGYTGTSRFVKTTKVDAEGNKTYHYIPVPKTDTKQLPLEDWDSLDEESWKTSRDAWDKNVTRYGTGDLLSKEEKIAAEEMAQMDNEGGYQPSDTFDLDTDMSEYNWQLVEFLRQAGYRDSEITEIWEEKGKAGLMGELCETYHADEAEVDEWIEGELHKLHEEDRNEEYAKLMGS